MLSRANSSIATSADCNPSDDDPARKSNEALAAQTQILYEDAYMLAVNKPAGLLTVRGTSGDYSLLDWLHNPDYQPVHRLDMDTSGIVLIAKTSDAYIRLQQLCINHMTLYMMIFLLFLLPL